MPTDVFKFRILSTRFKPYSVQMLSLSYHNLRQQVLSRDVTLNSYGLILQLQIHEQLNSYTVWLFIANCHTNYTSTRYAAMNRGKFLSDLFVLEKKNIKKFNTNNMMTVQCSQLIFNSMHVLIQNTFYCLDMRNKERH